jgi:hypothetical protein
MTQTIYFEPGLKPVIKFNPNHDPANGEFTTGSGGATSSGERKLREVTFTPPVAAPGTEGASTLDGAYKGFSLSGDETSALNSYLGNGYKYMNGILRGDIPTSDSTKLYEMNIEEMDKTIARAPIVKSETPIFRVFNAYNITHLKPGETYEDKGFMSTTLADISAKKGKSVRQHIGDIDPTMDVVGRIKPNGHYSGLSVNHADKDLAAFPQEKEFILPRGTQLKYLGMEKGSSGETIMTFERMNG